MQVLHQACHKAGEGCLARLDRDRDVHGWQGSEIGVHLLALVQAGQGQQLTRVQVLLMVQALVLVQQQELQFLQRQVLQGLLQVHRLQEVH